MIQVLGWPDVGPNVLMQLLDGVMQVPGVCDASPLFV